MTSPMNCESKLVRAERERERKMRAARYHFLKGIAFLLLPVRSDSLSLCSCARGRERKLCTEDLYCHSVAVVSDVAEK